MLVFSIIFTVVLAFIVVPCMVVGANGTTIVVVGLLITAGLFLLAYPPLGAILIIALVLFHEILFPSKE